MCRNNEQQTTSNGETWSRLPFDVNVMVNLNSIQGKKEDGYIWRRNFNNYGGIQILYYWPFRIQDV